MSDWKDEARFRNLVLVNLTGHTKTCEDFSLIEIKMDEMLERQGKLTQYIHSREDLMQEKSLQIHKKILELHLLYKKRKAKKENINEKENSEILITETSINDEKN